MVIAHRYTRTALEAAAETATVHPPGPPGRLRSMVARHPVVAFLVCAYGLGWPLLTVRTMTSFAPTIVGLAFTYCALLGSALAVTWTIGGLTAVRAFLARFLLWRLGLRRWALIVLALPALTTLIAAATGTLGTPDAGWIAVAVSYLTATFVYGALEVNLAEEGAWSGLVQTEFGLRHSVLGAALRTAPLFVAIHVPLQLTPGWSWPSLIVGVAVLAVIAPFFRYVVGETLSATGGSLLAAGVLHASFNASGRLGFLGGWQFLLALIVLALTLGVIRAVRAHTARH